jgi:hypothetical protein
MLLANPLASYGGTPPAPTHSSKHPAALPIPDPLEDPSRFEEPDPARALEHAIAGEMVDTIHSLYPHRSTRSVDSLPQAGERECTARPFAG